MRVKLDENLGTRTSGLFLARGHDVATVHGQGMSGASDGQLYGACIEEGRILVTLDLDFANPFRFDPAPTPGVVVVRVSETPEINELARVVLRLLDSLDTGQPRGRLWVDYWLRVREYRPPDPTNQ